MKKLYTFFAVKVLLFSFFLLSVTANAQHFTVTLNNFTSTSNTFEVDVLLIIEEPAGVRLTAFATGINFNPDILNGGTPCTVNNCGSWEYISGSMNSQLSVLNPYIAANRANPAGHLRILQIPTGHPDFSGVPVDLSPGTYKIGRFRFTNTVAWTADTDAQLWLTPTNTGGSSNTIVCFYPYGTQNMMSAYTTTVPEVPGGGVTLGYTQGSPLSRILNSALATPENQTNPLQVMPNPFSSTFQLDFESISNEPITVKVYDMLGKTIESQTVEANEVNTMQLGLNYPSGIYNVMVSQGEKTQNIKVIRR